MTGVIILLFLLLIVFGISIVMYLLQAVGLYRMGKTLEVSAPWLSFLPIVNIFALGKIAEKYIKADGRKSAKFSVILLILYIALSVVLLALMGFIIAISIAELTSDPAVNAYFESEQFAASAAFTMVLPVVLGYLATVGISIALSVVQYVAYWRVFAIFDKQNATLYLILSIFFSFLTPIFLFIIRNNEPQILRQQEYIM